MKNQCLGSRCIKGGGLGGVHSPGQEQVGPFCQALILNPSLRWEPLNGTPLIRAGRHTVHTREARSGGQKEQEAKLREASQKETCDSRLGAEGRPSQESTWAVPRISWAVGADVTAFCVSGQQDLACGPGEA